MFCLTNTTLKKTYTPKNARNTDISSPDLYISQTRCSFHVAIRNYNNTITKATCPPFCMYF